MSCTNHDEGKRKIKSVSIRSEDKCFCCRSTTGQLVSCSFCPKSFHATCLPEGISTTKPRWGCPSHKCSVCGMGTSKGRGKLYRCVGCPLAWCYDHLEKEHKPYNGNPFESLGLRVGSYSFVYCVRCRNDTEVRNEMHNLEEELLESGSEEERSCKRMKNARGQAKKARRTYPDQQLVDEVKRFMKEYSKLQKDVAQDIGASESVLSQYMHGVQRSNGWNVLEHKLVEWMEAVKAAEVPATPLPASPNRKRKFSEVAGKFDGLDSPRESYYSDSDFSTSPNHDQIYVQPASYQNPAIQSQQPQSYYYQPQQQAQSQPMQSQQQYQQRSQPQQQQPQQYNPYMPIWPSSASRLSSFSNAPAYSSYYPQDQSAYYYDNMHQQQQPVSHHSNWMPTEQNFPQPITATTRDGQSVYFL